MENFDVAIIGGGIVGAATFYQIQKRYPHLKIVLIEKEPHLAFHQTGNNSGVIHSGMYYPPKSLKAKNCIEGRKQLVEFAKKYQVPHEVCGKVVAASRVEELPFLEKIYQNGLQNQIEGLEKITPEQAQIIEPYLKCVAALWVPCTGIIDFRKATEKMVELALSIQPNSALILGEEVQNIVHQDHQTILKTQKNKYQSKFNIFCSGLQADRLAKMDGLKLKEKIVGFRGDYYELTEQAKHKVKNLIYPVPNPAFPFLGVHFTRMTSGSIECGPNAVFTFKREGYHKTDFDWRDSLDALFYSGTWALFRKNFRFGVQEYLRAFSKQRFLTTLQTLIPSLTLEDIQSARAGVRALLLSTTGDTRDDFRIETSQNSIHVLNAPSPAATASLAIGAQITDFFNNIYRKSDFFNT